jgi:hypothetical protein
MKKILAYFDARVKLPISCKKCQLKLQWQCPRRTIVPPKAHCPPLNKYDKRDDQRKTPRIQRHPSGSITSTFAL